MTTAAATRSWEAAGSLQPTVALRLDVSPIPKVESTRLFPQHKVQSNRNKERGWDKKRTGALPFPTSLRGAVSGRRAQQHRTSSAAGLEDGGPLRRVGRGAAGQPRDRVCELASPPSRPGAVRREYHLYPVPHKPRGHETRTPAASASLPV